MISERAVLITGRTVSFSSRSENNKNGVENNKYGAKGGSKGGSCPGPQTKANVISWESQLPKKKRLKVKEALLRTGDFLDTF